MNILQISDVHIGGEYDGKFKCKGNFIHTLVSAIQRTEHPYVENYDRIVITGDLADKDYEENYEWIRNILDLYGDGIPYFVIPGNHDNPDMMRKVFGDHTLPAGQDVLFDDENKIAYINSRVDATPLEDISFEGHAVKIVFAHHPFFTDVPHVFMKKWNHPDEQKNYRILKERGVKYLFCGH